MNIPVITAVSAQELAIPAGKEPLPRQSRNNSFHSQLEQISRKGQPDTFGVATRSGKNNVKAEELQPDDILPGQQEEILVQQSQENPEPSDINAEKASESLYLITDGTKNWIAQLLQLSSNITEAEAAGISELLCGLEPESVITEQADGTGKTLSQNASKSELNNITIIRNPVPESVIWAQPGEGKTAETANAETADLVNAGKSLSLSADGNLITRTAEQLILQQSRANGDTKVARTGEQLTLEKVISDQDSKVTAKEEINREAKPAMPVSGGEKAAKDAAELKQWVRELLLAPGRKPKAVAGQGAEISVKEDEDYTVSSKTSSATDIRKLVDWETQRYNTSRLSQEFSSIEGKVQNPGSHDESSYTNNVLSRNETNLFKAAVNVVSTPKGQNLPEPREIIAQIVKKAQLLFNHKLSELSIDLKPEFLGKLTIKVMVEEGIVTARFIAESQQVRQMLETNLNTLRHNLEAQGIRVDRTEVSVALNNGGMFDGSEGSRQYLWQQGQYSSQQQYQGYSGDNYEVYYSEDLDSPENLLVEQGINENGSMNFLV